MAVTGNPKFDGLAIVTLEANLPSKSLTARAAYIDTKTGNTHGYIDGNGHIWSPETKAALVSLAALMEKDMGRVNFAQSAHVSTSTAPASAPISGLGEHVGGDNTPST